MRRITIWVGCCAVLLLINVPSIGAKEQNRKIQREIPEQNGVFEDPDHPGIKVRVFVHGQRTARAPSSSLSCNLQDPDAPATVSATTWKLPPNWTYNLNPSSAPDTVGGTNLPEIAGRGFSDWASATGNSVSFARGTDTSVTRQAYDGKNIVAWGRTSNRALGVTYVRYYSASGVVVDVDTILNRRIPWTWANSTVCAYANTYDAENILKHEQGHWIGLADEYDAPMFENATMFGYGETMEVKKITLSTGDKSGALSLYNP